MFPTEITLFLFHSIIFCNKKYTVPSKKIRFLTTLKIISIVGSSEPSKLCLKLSFCFICSIYSIYIILYSIKLLYPI